MLDLVFFERFGSKPSAAWLEAVERAKARQVSKEHADPSTLLWGKTLASRSRRAVEAIRAMHPDVVPEILVLPVRGGHVPYLEWLAGEVR